MSAGSINLTNQFLIAMPGMALVRQFYVALKSQGHGRKGYHALLLVLEQLSGIKR